MMWGKLLCWEIFLFLCFSCAANAKSYVDACYLKWLHPPKTTSTFCLSVQHACNETRFMEHARVSTHTLLQFGCATMKPEGSLDGNRHHNPINTEDIEKDRIKNFVTVLRNPTSRIVSSFCDNMHIEGLDASVKEELRLKMDFDYHFGPHNKIRNDGWVGRWGNNESKCVRNFLIYAKFPPCHGCYTKMLNGFDCSANVTVTQSMVDRAVALLRQFLFVGIMEEYELSVKVFLNKALHSDAVDPATRLDSSRSDAIPESLSQLEKKVYARSSAKVKPHPIELSHFRAGSHLCAPALKRLAQENKLDYNDPYDNVLYEEALKLFSIEKKLYESELPA